MTSRSIFGLILFASGCLTGGERPAGAFEIDRYGTMIASTSEFSFFPDEPMLFRESRTVASLTRLRPFLDASLSETISIESAIGCDLSMDTSQSNPMFEPGMENRSLWRHPDLSRMLRNESGDASTVTTGVSVDRLAVQWRSQQTEVGIGRQAINWSGMFFLGPNDLFHPFLAQEFEKTYKTGVDAIRVRRLIGPLTELEICGVAGYDGPEPDWKRSAAVCRMITTAANLHIEILGGRYLDRTLWGGAMQGGVGRLGFRCEGRYLGADPEHDRRADFEAAGGLDYRSSDSMHLIIEYLYHERGVSDPDDYMAALASAARTDPFLARHYILLTLDHEIHPLIRWDVSILMNAVDGSGRLALDAAFSLADEADLIAGIARPFGDDAETASRPGESPIRLPSEFGVYPDVLYLELRVFL